MYVHITGLLGQYNKRVPTLNILSCTHLPPRQPNPKHQCLFIESRIKMPLSHLIFITEFLYRSKKFFINTPGLPY